MLDFARNASDNYQIDRMALMAFEFHLTLDIYFLMFLCSEYIFDKNSKKQNIWFQVML